MQFIFFEDEKVTFFIALWPFLISHRYICRIFYYFYSKWCNDKAANQNISGQLNPQILVLYSIFKVIIIIKISPLNTTQIIIKYSSYITIDSCQCSSRVNHVSHLSIWWLDNSTIHPPFEHELGLWNLMIAYNENRIPSPHSIILDLLSCHTCLWELLNSIFICRWFGDPDGDKLGWVGNLYCFCFCCFNIFFVRWVCKRPYSYYSSMIFFSLYVFLNLNVWFIQLLWWIF